MSNYVHLFSGSFVESNALTHELSKLGIQFIIKDQQNSANLAGLEYLIIYFHVKFLLSQSIMKKLECFVKIKS